MKRDTSSVRKQRWITIGRKSRRTACAARRNNVTYPSSPAAGRQRAPWLTCSPTKKPAARSSAFSCATRCRRAARCAATILRCARRRFPARHQPRGREQLDHGASPRPLPLHPDRGRLRRRPPGRRRGAVTPSSASLRARQELRAIGNSGSLRALFSIERWRTIMREDEARSFPQPVVQQPDPMLDEQPAGWFSHHAVDDRRRSGGRAGDVRPVEAAGAAADGGSRPSARPRRPAAAQPTTPAAKPQPANAPAQNPQPNARSRPPPASSRRQAVIEHAPRAQSGQAGQSKTPPAAAAPRTSDVGPERQARRRRPK